MKISIIEQHFKRIKNKTLCLVVTAITDGGIVIESSICTFTGIAKCSPEDKYNEKTGKRIAFARAETKAFKFYNKQLSNSIKIHSVLIEDAKNLCRKLDKQIAHNKEYITAFTEE